MLNVWELNRATFYNITNPISIMLPIVMSNE